MKIDGKWVERNLGFDPLAVTPPPAAFARAEAVSPKTPEDFQREIIDFDSEGPEGREFLAFSTATGLSRFSDIPWPGKLAPRTTAKLTGRSGSALPGADVLVVTWTVDEGHALSRVLTPGKDSRNNYLSYTHNYLKISQDMRNGCPAKEAKRLGAYWTTKIGSKSVVVFKSDSHMSQDGPKMPNIEVWRQIINEVRPKLVITTGTAGGIGTDVEVGDVLVSSIVTFDCKSEFENFKVDGEPIAHDHYSSAAADTRYFTKAKQLFEANSGQLPKDNTRPPKIIRAGAKSLNTGVLTTDFFGFDTSSNYYGLKDMGTVSEMGDAVLGLVTKEMGDKAPSWLAIRNVSDPQIASGNLSIRDQAKLAANIYKGYGRWSSVCSAIVCWASIAALK
jgi:nucleoside phosphorylase